MGWLLTNYIFNLHFYLVEVHFYDWGLLVCLRLCSISSFLLQNYSFLCLCSFSSYFIIQFLQCLTNTLNSTNFHIFCCIWSSWPLDTNFACLRMHTWATFIMNNVATVVWCTVYVHIIIFLFLLYFHHFPHFSPNLSQCELFHCGIVHLSCVFFFIFLLFSYFSHFQSLILQLSSLLSLLYIILLHIYLIHLLLYLLQLFSFLIFLIFH